MLASASGGSGGGGCWGKRRMMKQLLWVSFSESDRVVGSLLHFHVDARQDLMKAYPEVMVLITMPCTTRVIYKAVFTSVFLSYKDTTLQGQVLQSLILHTRNI